MFRQAAVIREPIKRRLILIKLTPPPLLNFNRVSSRVRRGFLSRSIFRDRARKSAIYLRVRGSRRKIHRERWKNSHDDKTWRGTLCDFRSSTNGPAAQPRRRYIFPLEGFRVRTGSAGFVSRETFIARHRPHDSVRNETRDVHFLPFVRDDSQGRVARVRAFRVTKSTNFRFTRMQIVVR